MTETELFYWSSSLVIALTLIWSVNRFLDFYFKEKRKLKADFMESFKRHEDASHPDLVTYTYTNKSPVEPLTTPPASESSSTGDHDLESYKDLSAGKYERFSNEKIKASDGYVTEFMTQHLEAK